MKPRRLFRLIFAPGLMVLIVAAGERGCADPPPVDGNR